MTKPKFNIADAFIHLNKFADMVRALHRDPDLPKAERRQLRAAIKIMKMDIEDLFKTIGADHEDAVRRV